MIFIGVVIFIGVFAVAVALLATRRTPRSGQVPTASNSTAHAARKSTKDPTVGVRKTITLSAIPMLHRMLMKFELAPQIRMFLYQANLKWTVGGLILMCMAFMVAGGYLVWLRTDASVFAMVCGLAAAMAPPVFVWMKRNKQFKKFEEGLPEALDLMVTAIRVGQSLNSALSLVARECPDPVGGEFRICFDEQNYGLELRAAMNNMVTRIPIQDLRLVTTAIIIQKESGGNLAEVLEKASHVTRERFRLKRQIMVHTAQGRLTGWVISLLPLGLGTVLYFLNPTLMSVLWTNPLGVKLLWTSGIMTVIGTLIIRKIVRIDV